MDKQEILNSVEQDVKPIYEKLKCWAHGWEHIKIVVKSAHDIAMAEGADPFPCQLAAYCHDLGRLEEEERGLVDSRPMTSLGHAGFSLKPAGVILDKYNITERDKCLILEAIRIHPSRKYEGDNQVALILQDADRSSGFGPMAILRFASFNCELPIDEPKNDDDVKDKVEQVIAILRDDPGKRQRMIETLRYVSDWYDVLLNTMSAREYLKEGYEYNKNFIRRISLDVV